MTPQPPRVTLFPYTTLFRSRSIMKFAVVGTGVIGSGWITRMLAHGHEVIATDPSEGAYERMLKQVKQNWPYRSEEHTSELQSLRHLVCRLLLEKKKKNKEK